MRIGYARVSTKDQDCALQLDALKAAGCEKIFEETASGAKTDRPELAAALAYMRDGEHWSSGSSIAWPAPCASSSRPSRIFAPGRSAFAL